MRGIARLGLSYGRIPPLGPSNKEPSFVKKEETNDAGDWVFLLVS